jgi:PKD repeat protein
MLSVLLLALAVVLVSRPATAATIITATYPVDSTTTNEGQSVVFRVELNSTVNVYNITVQWFKNGNPVVDPNLNYTLYPDFQSAGAYKIAVVILYGDITARHDWNLTVLKVKQKFSIDSVSPSENALVQLRELETRTFSVKVKNPSNDNLTYRWYINNDLQFGFISNDLTYVPDLDSSGDKTVKVDVESQDHMEDRSWKVKVLDALEVSPIGPQTIREGDSLAFKVLAPDLADAAIKWSLDGVSGPSDKGRSYRYSPDYMASGTHTLKMNTTDGLSYQWAIKVVDVDRAPASGPGKLVTTQVGKAVVFRGTATDPDNDLVNYEWDFDGDGVFEFTTDREETTSHTYKTAGLYMAAYRVTDAHGETATMVYPVQVTQPSTLSPWLLGSVLLSIIIILVIVWVVYDVTRSRKKARLDAEARAREREEVAARAKAKAEAPRPRREELPLFEDVHEPARGQAQDYSMVPYDAKMADRGQEAEGAVAEGEIPHTTEGEAATVEEGSEVTEAKEKEELDGLLKALGSKAGTKVELRSKKASAEAGAEDIDHGQGPAMRKVKKAKLTPKGQSPKKGPKKEPAKEDLKATGKGAESDIEAQSSDEVDQVMQKLVDMGLAERKRKE